MQWLSEDALKQQQLHVDTHTYSYMVDGLSLLATEQAKKKSVYKMKKMLSVFESDSGNRRRSVGWVWGRWEASLAALRLTVEAAWNRAKEQWSQLNKENLTRISFNIHLINVFAANKFLKRDVLYRRADNLRASILDNPPPHPWRHLVQNWSRLVPTTGQFIV